MSRGLILQSNTSFLERARDAGKIIVVDLGFLGDSVHLVPALWEIKRHYPRAQLHTLSAVVGAEVLRLAPCVDRAWAFPLTEKSPPWWRHWDILRALRRERFDVAINLSGSDRSIFLTAATGARWRLGYEQGRGHFWTRWLIPDLGPRQPRDVPVFEQRRRALAGHGFSLQPARFDLRIPDQDREWAATNIPAKSIHLSVNTTNPLREWPSRHWVSLAKKLLAEFPNTALIATCSSSPREQKRLAGALDAVADPRLQGMAGLPIGRVAAVLQRCQLHIGVDSGVLHLAMALGLATVVMFKRTEGLRDWMATGPKHCSIIAPCECMNSGREKCRDRGEAECLAGILPDQVFAEVRGVLTR